MIMGYFQLKFDLIPYPLTVLSDVFKITCNQLNFITKCVG
jgi:hypothetical protein